MHQKFTGQERDAETGLDFFHARYYGSTVGRFMNWLVSATDPPGTVRATEHYYYDGLGQRVAQDGPSGTTVYVYP